jgi:N-acetylmuramoyl-L-alanine amidase
MARLCFDYGHGGKDGGASYKGRKESDDVLSLGKAVAAEIRKYGVIVDETRTSDVYVSLGARSSFENKKEYDYIISFHRNAYKPEKAKGVETYVYTKTGSKAKSLAQKVQSALVGVGFVNRGVKSANFHVLRETKSPAILIEAGFIDSSADNNIFDSKRSQIVTAITKAILAQLGINYIKSKVSKAVEEKNKQASTSETFYRVLVGSYKDRTNAEKQVQKLKSVGLNAVIVSYNK